ncbi:XRE family transcriptional regulator [Exiguobacterium sp. SH3S2]|uniref:helix-turn-helix transcriptional regulator n=1 Tax=unclassified Exiguobacterium TaxID=2644629 RepID=UPI0010393363|nr:MULTISPECIES: helix-turn-helix transcriptional regulator [unclassified Exiguobacterium]TCI26190.1 XRE family transcriptional regulator [Exiguobacterium sp. SH5S4]TCI45717.1 XRE family transcriptional regulator [Exiguobacterium sp. SH3S3]TCI60127.1 XRE family transcriptional regulator [Exiguobacterium sp. SH3S1]TCI60926.1 XRE family transcriptional regulator [Exiguobacterium sp. SH3S2]
MNKSDFIQLVSKQVKTVRLERQYSQEEMADILGLSKKTLIQIEKERTIANWSTIVTLCSLFNDSEILLSEIGDDPVEFVRLIAKDVSYEPKSKTLGGRVWWKQTATEGDYVLQQNLISGHYRILDRQNVRWHSSFDVEEATLVLAKLAQDV